MKKDCINVIEELRALDLTVQVDDEYVRITETVSTMQGEGVIVANMRFSKKFMYIALPVVYHAYVMTIRYTQCDGVSLLNASYLLYIRDTILFSTLDITSDVVYDNVTSIAS